MKTERYTDKFSLWPAPDKVSLRAIGWQHLVDKRAVMPRGARRCNAMCRLLRRVMEDGLKLTQRLEAASPLPFFDRPLECSA